MKKEKLRSFAVYVVFLMMFAFSGVQLNAQDRSVTNSTNDNNTSLTEKGKEFMPKAQELSLDLMRRVGFSLEEAAAVRDVLIDYKENIAEAQEEFREKSNQRESEIGSKGNSRNDKIPVHGGDASYRNAPPDLMNEYRQADKEADEKIAGVLSDSEAEKYRQVKDQWWNKVKDEVFSSDKNSAKDKKDQQ